MFFFFYQNSVFGNKCLNFSPFFFSLKLKSKQRGVCSCMCAHLCLTLCNPMGRCGEVSMSLCRINGVYSSGKGYLMEKLHSHSV